MKVKDSIHMTISAVRGSGLRVFLTIFSMAVGVATVLTVLALGAAGEEKVEEEIVEMGVNRVWIRPAGESKLTESDAREISEKVCAPACAGTYTIANGSYLNKNGFIQIAGYDSAVAAVHAPKLIQGRLLRQDDFIEARNICLIDEVLDEYLGGNTLGGYIRILNRRMRIAGIIEPLTIQSLSGGDGMMILPLQTTLDTFGGKIEEITVSVQKGQDTVEIADAALRTLEKGAFRADTLEKEVNAARQIIRIFVDVLVCVACVSILSAGIGIMNVMIIAVRERRNEIGLIKAVGGTEGQIALLFLLEAGVYAMIGGMAGTAMGWSLISVCNAQTGLNAAAGIRSIIYVLIGTLGIGICFGVGPAIQAAGLQPVEALQDI